MLLSILVSLVSTGTAPILGALSRPANAWFLQQVTQRRPRLAAVLHNEEGLKPYSVSTLLDERGRPLPAGKWLQAGEPCWLRLTTFERQLSEVVLEQVLPTLPGHLELYKMSFRLDGATLDPAQHPWAGQSSYQALTQDSLRITSPRQVRLEFASPTAFRNHHADLPLPLPGQVFRSYWQKWNLFAPEGVQIQDLWPAFAADCIVISELSGLNTTRWSFADGTRGVATGFTGAAGFTLLPQKHCDDWAAYWPGSDRVMQTLAHYAFYCGTGHHATIGMGQTRLLPASPLFTV
jgi:CRISPR-associated endoribonuclease Cas6